jgi:ABC-type glycerol-3-phosphate transport system substrate-binding protein
MKTAYVTEMQEYMSVPLSLFGVRIFYNKDLLKQITGSDVAPLDYRQFLAVCEQIRNTTNPVSGAAYIPIAGSAYHFGHWDGMMFSPVTYGAFRRADFNRDGFVGNDETFVAFKTGLLDFTYPPTPAGSRCSAKSPTTSRSATPASAATKPSSSSPSSAPSS